MQRNKLVLNYSDNSLQLVNFDRKQDLMNIFVINCYFNRLKKTKKQLNKKLLILVVSFQHRINF